VNVPLRPIRLSTDHSYCEGFVTMYTAKPNITRFQITQCCVLRVIVVYKCKKIKNSKITRVNYFKIQKLQFNDASL